jgi:hypothetical protein
MSSLPILDRERKRKSKKGTFEIKEENLNFSLLFSDRSRVAQSPARQVNSLPRPSLRQIGVTLVDPLPISSPLSSSESANSRVPIFGLPKRSSSFHVKSASISCERIQPAVENSTTTKLSDRKDKSLGDLTSTTPVAPRRFSSQERFFD